MWSFVGNKNTKCWIWLVLDKINKKFLGFVTGRRDTKTGKKLWEKIKDLNIQQYATDEWEAYKKFLPKEKHLVGKRYTQDIEGFNSNFRLFLKRLNRRTKCYSKSQEMLECSLKLLISKFNGVYS